MASRVKKQNFIERLIGRVDAFQQRHRILAFPYAVVKKFSDDEGGYQAALIAYYGFLSLFPLLIVATAVIQIIAQGNSDLRESLLGSITSYFPALGQNLADSISTPGRSGVALFLGLLITFYGAKGVADAVQHALHHVWAVPRHRRTGFPKSTLRSFSIIIFAGIGLVVAASLTGFATSGARLPIVRMLLWLGGFIVLASVFWAVFTYGSSARKRPFANIPGALFASVAFTALQALGAYIIAHQLKGQTGLNAQFAVVIALLFWLYLQARVLVYALEINVVRAHKLWPRSITPKPPLPADEKAYDLYRRREIFIDTEPVS
ncbi:YihY/virulence factor BrkB family protein [Candidatus Saccharibacteria bacterium]|nr:MAG: YihY/virulence factor BrkB family protein [Candidatus Saccharibacteria bacterium]